MNVEPMETPRFKLYHYPATRSTRVKWMLHEVLDDDFEVELVPVYEGKPKPPEDAELLGRFTG